MKKAVLTLVMALLGFMGAYAQHAGQAGIGLNLGVAPCIEKNNNAANFILGGRIHYSATDLIRLAGDFDYGFKDDGVSTFTAMANVHFMIPLVSNIYLYPLAGIGYGNIHVAGWDYEFNDEWVTSISKNYSRFAFNVGIGAEFEATRNFSFGVEFKYQYMKDYERLPITLTASYKF